MGKSPNTDKKILKNDQQKQFLHKNLRAHKNIDAWT